MKRIKRKTLPQPKQSCVNILHKVYSHFIDKTENTEQRTPKYPKYTVSCAVLTVVC